MPIISARCPDCNGKIHRESFYGSHNNKRAYVQYDCAGDTALTEGMDGSRKSGCDFIAKKRWNSENSEESAKIRLNSEVITSWSEWQNYLDEHNNNQE